MFLFSRAYDVYVVVHGLQVIQVMKICSDISCDVLDLSFLLTSGQPVLERGNWFKMFSTLPKGTVNNIPLGWPCCSHLPLLRYIDSVTELCLDILCSFNKSEITSFITRALHGYYVSQNPLSFKKRKGRDYSRYWLANFDNAQVCFGC